MSTCLEPLRGQVLFAVVFLLPGEVHALQSPATFLLHLLKWSWILGSCRAKTAPTGCSRAQYLYSTELQDNSPSCPPLHQGIRRRRASTICSSRIKRYFAWSVMAHFRSIALCSSFTHLCSWYKRPAAEYSLWGYLFSGVPTAPFETAWTPQPLSTPLRLIQYLHREGGGLPHGKKMWGKAGFCICTGSVKCQSVQEVDRTQGAEISMLDYVLMLSKILPKTSYSLEFIHLNT